MFSVVPNYFKYEIFNGMYSLAILVSKNISSVSKTSIQIALECTK